MKRNKKLIILLVVFIVLVLSAVAVSKLVPTDEELSGSVDFADIGHGDIAKLSWVYDGEESSFLRTDDGWEMEGDSQFPTNDIMLDSMEGALIGVMSSEPISGNPSDYGISDMSDSITVTKKDGTQLTMVFGDINEITDEYYMTVNGSDEIYLLDAVTKETFNHTTDNLLEREEIPSLSNPAKITVGRGEANFELTKENDTWKSGDTVLSTDKVNALIQEITYFIWSDCVSYNATDEELAGFGLSEPTLELKIELEDGSEYNFCFGTVEGENVYVKYKDSKMVYSVDTALYSAVPQTVDELV